jgi:hypothetical protein
LKVYVKFFCHQSFSFQKDERLNILEGRENEYQLQKGDYTLFFDEWPWGIVAYHSLEEEGTDYFKNYLKRHPSLRNPWTPKNKFEAFKDELLKQGGRVTGQRSLFEPYDQYSGYGLTVEVRGPKTNEIIEEIGDNYAIHPKRIGIEIDVDGSTVKFDMTNDGRMSFSRGPIESIVLLIGRYATFIRNCDENYEFKQSRKTERNGVIVREANEILSMRMPSLEKIKGTAEERNKAIVNMLTRDKGAYGYIGIPLGPDRVNVLDLEDRKSFQVTIIDDELIFYSENPSQVRSTVRRLVSKLATHIDPDVNLEKLQIGEM